jgi:hypothetical protein
MEVMFSSSLLPTVSGGVDRIVSRNGLGAVWVSFSDSTYAVKASAPALPESYSNDAQNDRCLPGSLELIADTTGRPAQSANLNNRLDIESRAVFYNFQAHFHAVETTGNDDCRASQCNTMDPKESGAGHRGKRNCHSAIAR